MNRNNYVDKQHQSDGSDIAEVVQLCHEYSSEHEDFPKLGFQCLLKKLKEIEKIILAISKMSGNEALQNQKNSISAFKDDEVEAANLSSSQRAQPKDIQLPDDLTFHSKQVLHEIFQQFEVNIHEVTGRLKVKFLESINESYCVMESTVNTLSRDQKAGAKSFIEGLLNADMQCFDENTSKKQRNAFFKQVPPASNDYELLLPKDLSPLTKSVLNEIFANYETNVATFAEKIKKQIYELLIGAYGQFESNVNLITESQSTQLRQEMESVFSGQGGMHHRGPAPKGEVKVQASKGECSFDVNLARHFQELSRVVQAILDKKDNANVAIDENRLAVADKDQKSATDIAPDQISEQVPVAGNAHRDDSDETKYMGVPEFKMEKKRLARLI